MGLFYLRLTKEESNHKNIIKIRSLSNRFNKANCYISIRYKQRGQLK
jgi:hypothetical protein